MRKKIIYLLLAAIGTVGFYSCGPSQGTNERGTNEPGTETTTDPTGNTTETTTGTTRSGNNQ